MEQGTKICSKCSTKRSIDDFHLRRRSNGNVDRQAWCKPCQAVEQRRYLRKRRGLPLDAPPMRGARPSFAIGTRRTHSGYVYIKVEQHHRADRWGWVFEHIVVAEQKFGITITRDFTVHHVNGDRADNRPENLELRWGNHGKGADVLPGLLRDPAMRAVARRVLAEYDD